MNRQQRRAAARGAPQVQRFERDAASPVRGRQVFGGYVPFADAATQTADGWTVLAYAVALKESGVALTRRDFEDCVRNFAVSACSPVTIEHADTDPNPFAQPPREWREPNGHIEELRVGTMLRGSQQVATLEGRVSYLEPTRTDVANRKWRFGSITIIQGAVDEETGNALGSVLWSWSLTAHPRLTGLPALAASRRTPTGELVEAGYWWGDIDDRDDLLSCLRTLLDLPVTSTEAEVLAGLAKLEGYVADPASATAAGVETDDLVCRLRDALRLPALTSASDVLAEVRKGLETLPTETPAATPASASMSARGKAAATTETLMPKFLELAARLGLTATSEDDARDKVLALLALGADALRGLGLSLSATPADVAASVKEFTSLAAKLPALETELATFRAERVKSENELRAAWLDDLIAARPELATVRASLALHADRDWQNFQASYPRPTRDVLVTAAAEAAQRAQDPARTAPGTVTAANPATKDAPAAQAPKGPDLAAFRAVLAEHGYPSDAASVAEAIAKGHTPATLRAALAAA